MAYRQWSKELCLGIEDIDVQHQRLIRTIDELHEAMMQRRGKSILSSLLVNHIQGSDRAYVPFLCGRGIA